MANRIGQTVVVAVEPWEARLAKNAVSRLNGDVPAGAKPQIVEALLARLQKEKTSRLPDGQDSWEAHAHKAVQALLMEILEQARRKAEITAFFHANHGRALAYAEAILKNLAAAQDAVSKTYLELLEGKTTTERFFRALKNNARDILRRLSREAERFEPTERVFDPRHLAGEDRMSGGESAEFSLEPASSRLEDQDPLDQLIQREEQEEREQMVQVALKDPRWRFCKRRKWAQPLLAHVSK